MFETRNVLLGLFIVWFLSIHFYLPAPVSIVLGAVFVAAAAVALANYLGRPRAEVNRDGSLGL